ncbi:MAG TPA: helix-turn-helix domain-containing protein [Thermoanaerobaculia bacterium]|nr:helix-turn-helix domain-containing protein [Thermoanaerobaculia bacterium]
MQPAREPAGDAWRVVEQSAATPVGSWRMVLAMPSGPLAERVEAVWSSEGSDCFAEEEILPRSRTEVLFCLGDRHWLRDRQDRRRDRAFDTSFVSGLQRRPLHVVSPPTTAMSGVRLRPAGVAPFLRDLPQVIAGSVVELDGILGPEVETLREQIASTRDLRRRTLLLAAAVARHLDPTPAPCVAVRFVLSMLHASRGAASIRELVRATGFSHRWVTERFRAEIGLAPKAYARLVRFESAFERLCALEGVHWAEFALDCGYYDQAHLVREFRELAGATPGEVFRRRAPDGLGLLDEETAARLA